MINRVQAEQEIINQGQDPNDFNIQITKEGYSITPKWFYEQKQIAKKEDIALGLEISAREIENIELGQQLSNLEIQLLELQLGGI